MRYFILFLLFPSVAFAQYVPYATVQACCISQPHSQSVQRQPQFYQQQDYHRAYVSRRGYNGRTGHVDTVYIPAGNNPNPPANIYGRR